MSTHENQVGAPPKTPREPDGTDPPGGTGLVALNVNS